MAPRSLRGSFNLIYSTGNWVNSQEVGLEKLQNEAKLAETAKR
jgi:hypothetical protein